MTRNEAVCRAKAASQLLMDEVEAEAARMLDESLAEAKRTGNHVGGQIRLDCMDEIARVADQMLERLPDVMVAALPATLDDGNIDDLRAKTRSIARKAANQAVFNLRQRIRTDLRPN